MFMMVKTQRGASIPEVQKSLEAKLDGLEVFTNEQMHKKTQFYWVFQTGAGITTLMGSVLGLIVGIVVVAQTIYSATVDHIREFGTLKAMGAANARIYQVILAQATLAGAMGYAVAIVIAEVVSHGSQNGNAPILLPPGMALGTLILAVGMCAGASIISIRKATTIDPAMVFRG